MNQHFKTGTLNDLPKEILDSEDVKRLTRKFFTKWMINMARRTVITHLVKEKLDALEEKGGEGTQAMLDRARNIVMHANSYSRIFIH